jgi:hypothetical protein
MADETSPVHLGFQPSLDNSSAFLRTTMQQPADPEAFADKIRQEEIKNVQDQPWESAAILHQGLQVAGGIVKAGASFKGFLIPLAIIGLFFPEAQIVSIIVLGICVALPLLIAGGSLLVAGIVFAFEGFSRLRKESHLENASAIEILRDRNQKYEQKLQSLEILHKKLDETSLKNNTWLNDPELYRRASIELSLGRSIEATVGERIRNEIEHESQKIKGEKEQVDVAMKMLELPGSSLPVVMST